MNINKKGGDLEKWFKANEIRENVLQSLKAVGEGHQGAWRDNPVFDFFQMDAELSLTDFSVVYAKPEMMEKWNAGEDNEIVIIIMDGNAAPDSLYVHLHDGGTIITGLGQSFGLPVSHSRLLRGKFHLQNVLDEGSRVILNAFKLDDLKYKCIHGLEPHGFITMKDSITFALAVTCARFNNDGELDFTVVDPGRCVVRSKSKDLVPLDDYASRSIGGRVFI